MIFSNVVLILWISNFYPWSFCKTFSDFWSYRSIKIDGIIFSNLLLIVLIPNFFWPFCKVYYSFLFHPLITTLFLFFMLILILILLIAIS
jgi:hypothetical protein